MLDEFLRSLGLESHAAVFRDNEVDFDTLRILTESDLAELGLPFGPRKKLLHALARLDSQETTSAPPPSIDAVSAAATPAAPTPTLGTDDGERRQLTVLFCDMVGFTDLAGRVDPEVLRAIIRDYEDACAACITRYEGYVFQRLGDGIVAFFGFPLAHEGEAERAVRAALDILERLASTHVPEMGRLRVRIGVATGLVVVSTTERSAVGETMNLASRLQGIANPDEIVVSEQVYRLASGIFKYEDLGERKLKGIPQAARAYRVLGVGSAASRFEAATGEALTPLVGRQREISTLLDLWERASKGAGQAAAISGEAGVGKSRLLSALREATGPAHENTLGFQCSPFHTNSAFHPFIERLERKLAFERGEPHAARLERLEAFVLHHGLPLEDVRFVASLLSIPCDDRYGPSTIPPRRFKQETVRALADLAMAAARVETALMLFEDAHWADPSSIEVLDLLIERIGSVPLLVVLTHRPEFTAGLLERAYVTRLHLSRLGQDECHAIAERLAGGKRLPEGLITEIVNKADGVPLFVEELTKSVLESGDLESVDGHYVYARSRSTFTVPATLSDSLMARLDRLNAVKEIAQVGSAIGRAFSYELLAAVLPMPVAVLDEGLEGLTAAGLVFRRGTGHDATFTFKHALLQDAAYDSMLRSRRQELHAAIAAVLEERFPGIADSEPEVLGRHYAAAGNSDRAITLWKQAGQAAIRRVALPEGIAHLRAGLACVESLPAGRDRDLKELELRTLLGPAVVARRGWASPEVAAELGPAWTLAESLEHRESFVPVLHGMWVHYMSMAHLRTSLVWAQRMLDHAERARDDALRICGHRAAMTSHFWIGELQEALRHGDVIRELYDAERHRHIGAVTNSDPLTGDGIYRSHLLWMLGYPDRARRVSEETAEHARRRNHPFDIAFALTLGAQSFEYCGEHDRLLACAEEAERVGRQFGLPLMSEMMAEISRGKAWLLAGQIDRGTGELRQAAARLAGTGHRVWIAYLEACVGEAMARSGDLDGGLAQVERSLARPSCKEDRVHLAEMLRLKGMILREQGRLDEAEHVLRSAIDVAREQHARSWELRACTALACLLAGRGDGSGARELLAPVYGWFTEGFETPDLVQARQLLDSLGA